MYIIKNNIQLTIKKATCDDCENIISNIKTIIKESDNLTYENNEFSPNIDKEKQFIKEINTSKNKCFLIALINNEIVGNISVNNINRKKIKHIGTLSITILKKYWNYGIASCLMIELEKWIKTTSLTKINLKVKEDNIYAIKLYKKFGFIQEGIISRDFLIDRKYYNSIFMGKVIT